MPALRTTIYTKYFYAFIDLTLHKAVVVVVVVFHLVLEANITSSVIRILLFSTAMPRGFFNVGK